MKIIVFRLNSWIYDGVIHWCIFVALNLDELAHNMLTMVILPHSHFAPHGQFALTIEIL